MSERVFRSAREWCAAFFPRRHAARECGCYRREREERRGVLVIQPRSGRQFRRI